MTDWGPVILILAVGLITGGAAFFLLARGGRAGAARPAERPTTPPTSAVRDLRARRDLLIERLQTLHLEGHPEDVLEAQRRDLELEAARVLRDLDAAERRAEAAQAQQEASPPAARPASALRGFAWGVGSAAFLALLLVFVLQGSKERREGAPVTGGVPGIEFGAPPSAGQPAPDPELEALMAAASAQPTDVGAQLDLIQGLIVRDRLIAAWDVIQRLSAIAPDHPRKLMYEATVREAMGQFERAKELLDRAVEGDPSLSEAWVRRGLVAFELGDWLTAATSWETALEQRPDGREALEPVIAEAKRRHREGVPTTERAPAGQPPADAQQPAPHAGTPVAEAAPARADSGDVRITLDLSDAAKAQVRPGAIVFVTARPAGITSGPPLAAKRIPASDFPLEVRLGKADSMMGQPFPEATFIEARLDADGNAMTRGPDDPTASADDVRKGAEVRLVLE